MLSSCGTTFDRDPKDKLRKTLVKKGPWEMVNLSIKQIDNSNSDSLVIWDTLIQHAGTIKFKGHFTYDMTAVFSTDNYDDQDFYVQTSDVSEIAYVSLKNVYCPLLDYDNIGSGQVDTYKGKHIFVNTNKLYSWQGWGKFPLAPYLNKSGSFLVSYELQAD